MSETVSMKSRSGAASQVPDQAHELRAELARKIASFMGSEESRATEISGLTLGRRTATTARCSMTYEPSVIVIGSALAEPACPREIQRILIEGVAIE